MRRERRRVFSDPEVLELFQEEPELVAIVDAIAATQSQPKRARRRAARVLLAAAVVASAVFVAILVPWGGEGGGIEERALAAVGSGDVVHAVLRTEAPSDVLVVELTTGKRLPSTVELESWFDSRRSQVRTVTRRNGVVIDVVVNRADAVSSAGAPNLDPGEPRSAGAIASLFATEYRAALEAGRSRVVGRGTVDGRRVAWLEFDTSAGQAEQVAVDEETGRPLRVRFLASSTAPADREWNVAKIETLPAGGAALDRPRPLPAGPSAGAIKESNEASLAEATAALGDPVVHPGEEIDGLRLASVRVHVLSRTFPDGEVKLARGVELVYRGTAGPGNQTRYLRVRQAPAPEPAYGFVEGRLTRNLNPIPRPGVVDLAFDGESWVGQLRSRRLYVTLESPDRSTLLAAARALASVSPAGR